jgi:hypothetical protein
MPLRRIIARLDPWLPSRPETIVRILVMALISLHALAGVFWAGSTLALTHTSPPHRITPQLFRAQMAAAVLAVLAGCAEHVRQLGGVSPLPSLVKAKG